MAHSNTSAAQRPKNNSQLRAIFAEGHKRGLDDEAIRDVVESTTRRTRSLRELSHTEAQKVLRRLKGSGFVPTRTMQYRRAKQGVKQLITDAQRTYIAQLASQRGWSPETLTKFCKRQCSHHPPRTTEDANKVIEGLKNMNQREGLWTS